MPSQPPPTRTPTYYEILNLSPSTLSSLDDNAASQLIKRAYRRALLNHHPDKKAPNHHHHHHPHPSNSSPSSSYTIDQISTAYATLSNPAHRQAYDRSLLLQQQSRSNPTPGGQQDSSDFQTGIETVDLDDLDYEEYTIDTDADSNSNNSQPNTASTTTTTTKWYRSCRCGNPRGYHFTEADLEEASDLGELMVGCADCSLWLRVHFAVVDDDDDEGPGYGDRNGVERNAAGTVVSG